MQRVFPDHQDDDGAADQRQGDGEKLADQALGPAGGTLAVRGRYHG